MIRSAAFAISLAPLVLAGCTYGMNHDSDARRQVADVPQAKVTGKPQSCVPLSDLRDSRIRDDRTIDFIRAGKKGWRVSLDSACPGLKSENKFTYETSLSQLCSTDIIYVLHDYGGSLQRGAGCGLSQFVPIELVK